MTSEKLPPIVSEVVNDVLARWSDEDGDYDPQAMCKEISEDLALELRTQGIPAKAIQGTFALDTSYDEEDDVDLLRPVHYWVLVSDKILDITAVQFKDEVEEDIPEVVFGSAESFPRYHSQTVVASGRFSRALTSSKKNESKDFYYLWIEGNEPVVAQITCKTRIPREGLTEEAAKKQAAKKHGEAAVDFSVSIKRPKWWPYE